MRLLRSCSAVADTAEPFIDKRSFCDRLRSTRSSTVSYLHDLDEKLQYNNETR